MDFVLPLGPPAAEGREMRRTPIYGDAYDLETGLVFVVL